MKALWEKRLKVAKYSDVNDPFELLPFNVQKKKTRAFWKDKVASFIDVNWGFLCFSEDWQTTLMWSHYGEKHTGICLGFDVPADQAIKIRYIDVPRPDPLDHKQALKGVTNELFEDAMRFKYSGWSYEREWRLRVPLIKSVDGIFYRHFDDALHLREVILGPRCSLTSEEVVEAVISPPLDVEIFQARAAFGRFEICRQELIDMHTKKGFRAALALAKPLYADELPDDE